MTEAPTYTNRSTDIDRVKSLESGVLFESGWGFGAAPERRALLTVDQEYFVESARNLQITGMATVRRDGSGTAHSDGWLWRDSDQDLTRQHAEFVADMKRRDEERWAANQDDWRRREAALPAALRRRLERFRANGGHEFEVDGWGYELVICELAVLYAASDQADSDDVMAYARIEGTSGNQHDYAKALSRLLTEDRDDQDAIANSVSALSPITGNADYSPTGGQS